MQSVLPILCALLATGLTLRPCCAESPNVWGAFLGAGHSAIDPSGIPTTWSPEENVAWSVALPGYGQSSPVIFGDRIFVTSIEGENKERNIVSCYDLKSGEKRWQRNFPSSDPVKNSTFVSRAAPTPAVDANGVYAFFESGDVVLLTHAGEEVWRRSLSKDYGQFENEYGLGASPVLIDGKLVLLIDHPGPSYLIAIDAATGKTAWKTDRESRGSWSSPMLLKVGEETQVLCSSGGTIDAYAPQNGELLWAEQGIGGNRICSPFVFADGTFLVGSQTSREFKDEDSVKRSNLAMQVRREGKAWKTEVLWRNEKMTPGMASPVAFGGHAYWVNRSGAVMCLDAETGEERYTERLQQSCWATPLGIGDRLYLFGKDGLTSVISLGSKFKLLAENQLWDPDAVVVDPSIVERETEPRRKAAAAMHSGPEVMGVACVSGSLIVRTGDRLYCIRSASAE
ncbi:MAG: PQQ-binding-like beta-propeller repeat protein [Blastopirellula sp. JB062]